MRIPIRAGFDFYGHLQQPDGSSLATRCLFINYLPIAPTGTYRLDGGRAAPAPFSFKSLFAAYFKAWGFLAACGIAAYGIAWGSWYQHPELARYIPAAGVLFACVYASWLFLGHRSRTGTRWGIVGGMAALTVAVLAYGVVFNLGEIERRRRFEERDLPPADIPFTISVMKSMPGGPKPDELKHLEDGTALKAGQAVLIELSSGTAMGIVEHSSSSDPVEVRTRGGGSKPYRVPRERIWLTK